MDGAELKTNTKMVLVVDDGSVERLAGKVLLERLGFSVDTAGSGEEALAMLHERRFDLALCDISMPDMSGLEVLQAMQEHPAAPRFIMVTSHDDQDHASASLRQGAAAYLVKPLRFDTLRATVSAVLAQIDAADS